MTAPRDDDRPVFRSLAAPGLEEDDLFVAMQGLPAPGAFWGEGWPALRRHDDRPWCEDEERRRRHEALLRKWPAQGPAQRAARGSGAPPPRA